MTKLMSLRLLNLGLMAGLGMSLLSGCKEEKNIDYAIEGVTEESEAQNSRAKSGVEQFQDEAKWEEEWEDSFIDVVVDAKIMLPEAEQMSVIEAIEPEFDVEYKEQMAKHLFDNEDIYYGDINHLTRKDLDEIQSFFDAGGRISLPHFQYEEKLEKWLTEYKTALENPKDSYTLVNEYKENEYIGTYEGMSYKLSFVENENDYNLRRMKEVHFEPKNMQDVSPAELQQIEWPTCKPWMQGDLIENHAKISEEEALKEARRFVEKLGMDYSVLSYPRPLVWGDATISDESMIDWVANGYVFSFDVGIDDISFVEYGTEEDYSDFMVTDNAREKNRLYSMETRVQIYVTDKGVIQMSAYNPIELTGISERVDMLPLDTIKSIIKEQLATRWVELLPYFSSSKIWFDNMELIYFRVADKENPGHYSYVPTWRLANVTRDEALHTLSISNPILINAIDGSVVDIYNEM